MTHKEAVKYAYDQYLRTRHLLHFLESERMENFYDRIKGNEALLETFEVLVLSGNVNRLRELSYQYVDLDITEMNIKQLKDLAKQYNVPYYYRLNKMELEQEIIYARKARRNQKVAQ